MSEPDYAAELDAVLAVVDRETRAFWDKDFDAWSHCWAHVPYTRTMGYWPLGGVSVVEGWEAQSALIRRMMDEAGGALVIDPEAEDQLVAAIEEVMAQPDAAAERARAGRRWVETGFIRDDLARRMARFLEQIVAREGRG